jgi:hypothetical protein
MNRQVVLSRRFQKVGPSSDWSTDAWQIDAERVLTVEAHADAPLIVRRRDWVEYQPAWGLQNSKSPNYVVEAVYPTLEEAIMGLDS